MPAVVGFGSDKTQLESSLLCDTELSLSHVS
jgi:hypothetical protein